MRPKPILRLVLVYRERGAAAASLNPRQASGSFSLPRQRRQRPTAANPLSPQQHAQKKLGRQRTEPSPMAPADGGGEQAHKAHRQHKSGAKARKKKGKGAAGDDAGGEQKNPKVRFRFAQALDYCPWSELPWRFFLPFFIREPDCSVAGHLI